MSILSALEAPPQAQEGQLWGERITAAAPSDISSSVQRNAAAHNAEDGHALMLHDFLPILFKKLGGLGA